MVYLMIRCERGNPTDDSEVFGLNCRGTTGAIFSENVRYEMHLEEDSN